MRLALPGAAGLRRTATACVVLLLAGCSGPVSVESPAATGADARACSALVKALPDRVADQDRREVRSQKGSARTAAWGDPAIELRCGVPRPRGFDKFSGCQEANGVDWYIPESQQKGQPVAITMTTVGRAQNVEVSLPADYFPPVEAMVDLAPAVKRTLRKVDPCV